MLSGRSFFQRLVDRREWLRSHSQRGTSDEKEVKEREKRKKEMGKGKKKGGDMYVQGNSHTGGTMKKKTILY